MGNYMTAKEVRALQPEVDLDTIMEEIQRIATSSFNEHDSITRYNLEPSQITALEALGYKVDNRGYESQGTICYVISW